MAERKQRMLPSRPPPGSEDEDLLATSLPVDPDAPEFRREPAPMRALVEGVLQRLNLPAQEFWREELAVVWPKAVPAELSGVVRPGKWENGILYLHVPNSMKLFEVQRLHLRGIEKALRQHFGAARLKQVRLMIEPDGTGAAKK